MSDFRAIEKLIAAGQKIGAIKEFRALTRVGLLEAKNAVEWFTDHGQWPAQYHGGSASAAAGPVAAPASLGSRRAEIEQFMAQRRKINAIKVLREVTGWGLVDSKRAVDLYEVEGVWPAEVLARLDGGAGPSPTVAADAAASSPTNVPLDPIVAALEERFGSRPSVRLSAACIRGIDRGVLMMLDDRACFVITGGGRPSVALEFRYGEVTRAELDSSLGVDLNITLGATREVFTRLDADEAAAALALLRVFAP